MNDFIEQVSSSAYFLIKREQHIRSVEFKLKVSLICSTQNSSNNNKKIIIKKKKTKEEEGGGGEKKKKQKNKKT